MLGMKIKAWDTSRKKMWSAEELGQDQVALSPDGRGFVNVHGDDLGKSQYWEHMIPLLCSGQRDRGDIEVYEGDVLDNPRDSFGRNYLVSWAVEGGGFWFEPVPINGMRQFGGRLDAESLEGCSLIGNKYENPELMEV